MRQSTPGASMKYLHQHGPHTFWLDHRLTPEVRAMLCAMVSRSPVGGIRQRYTELVEAVARDMLAAVSLIPYEEARANALAAGLPLSWVEEAEDALCTYPLHPKVQDFFDRNVKLYGHSSVLTGSPAVFVEGLSWFGAWLLFDSPLVCGQEASTRAMDFSQRAMCVEAGASPDLVELHDAWMEVFRAEVEAWKVELVKPCDPCNGSGGESHPCVRCNGSGRKYPWMKDPQPFRPAFDRARWALPGTLSTGVAFASHVRERARAIHDAELVAQASGNLEAIALFREVRECYAAAVPGIGALGLREAVYEPSSMIPGHLRAFGDPQGPASAMAQIGRASTRRWTCDVNLVTDGEWPASIATPWVGKGYVDPLLNRLRVTVLIRCSLAVARDWHRHRCLAPDTLLHFDAPKSEGTRRSVYKMRIEDVWKKWQPTTRKERPERQKNALWPRARIQGMKLRCLDESSGEITWTSVEDVIMGTPKAMVTVHTRSGRSLTATKEHQVLTDRGWMTLGEAIDQKALLSMESRKRNHDTLWEVPVDTHTEAWRPVVGWEDVYSISSEGRIRKGNGAARKAKPGKDGYPVVELNRGRKDRSNRTIHSLVLEAFVGPRPWGLQSRHRNNNRGDSRLSNLQWGSAAENAQDRIEADRHMRLVSCFEEIVEVTDAGILPSYDIEVTGPWHNFIADGFVVHNSFYPWTLHVVRGLDSRDPIEIDHHYEPISELGLERTADLCRRSTELYDRFMASGDRYSAMLCLPLGTRVCLTAQAGLRDAVYTFELRRDAAGANFEYREQAAAAIKMMQRPGSPDMPPMVSDEVLDLIGWERK